MKEIFKRVSTRKYLEKDVEDKKIEKLLRAAMSSPSAMNQQPWRFIIVRNQVIKDELAKCSPYSSFINKAPVIIVILKDIKDLKAGEYADIDCAIATENIMLEAIHLNLGTVMIGIAPVYEREDNVRKVLDINDPNLIPFTLIPVGYPTKEKEQVDRFDEEKIKYLN